MKKKQDFMLKLLIIVAMIAQPLMPSIVMAFDNEDLPTQEIVSPESEQTDDFLVDLRNDYEGAYYGVPREEMETESGNINNEEDIYNPVFLEDDEEYADELPFIFNGELTGLFVRAYELRNQPRRHPDLTVEEAIRADFLADDLQYLVHGNYTGDLYYDGLPWGGFNASLGIMPTDYVNALLRKGLHPDLNAVIIQISGLSPNDISPRNAPSITGFRHSGYHPIANAAGGVTPFAYFEINVSGAGWRVAFCINFNLPSPTGMAQITGTSIYRNELIRRALWFGYGGGSGHWPLGIGGVSQTNQFSRHHRIHAMTRVMTYIMTGSYPTGGFNATSPADSAMHASRELWERVQSNAEIGDGWVRINRGNFETATLSISTQNGVQRSQNVRVEAYRGNTFQITVPGDVTVVNETLGANYSWTGGAGTIWGGDVIRFEAPMNSNSTVNTGQVRGVIPEFAPLRINTVSGVQNLATGWQTDPINFFQLFIDFVPQYTYTRARKLSSNTNQPIADTVFEFQIWRNNAWESHFLTTGANGNTPWLSGLMHGESVRVREYSVPAPYVVNRTWYNFTAVANPGTYFTFVQHNRQAVGRVIVTKYSSSTGGVLPGTVFEIRGNGITPRRATTGANGQVVFDNLPLGIGSVTYTIEEISVPAPYVLPPVSQRTQTITLSRINQETAITTASRSFTNDPAVGYIRILKRDSVTGNIAQGEAELFGAVFHVYAAQNIVRSNGTIIYPAGMRVDTVTIGQNHEARTRYLPLGIYNVREVMPGVGYNLNMNTYRVELRFANQHTPIVTSAQTVYNEVIEGRISIVKIGEVPLFRRASNWLGDFFRGELRSNSENRNLRPTLEGVEFTFFDRNNNIVYVGLTDENGFLMTPYLPFGTYRVSETYVPEGFIQIADFYVRIDEHGRIYFFVIENRVIRSYIRIIKTDATTGNVIPVAGTTFRIWCLRTEDWVVQRVTYPTVRYISEFRTAGDGMVHLPQTLPYGVYEVHEIKAPYGYLLSTEPIRFYINQQTSREGVVIEIEFGNLPAMGRIVIDKADEVTGEPLADATFVIRAREDIVTLDGTLRAEQGEIVDTLVTDKYGFAESVLLFLGAYEVQEVIAPSGFILSDKINEVDLVYADQYTAVVYSRLEIENRPNRVILTKYETGSRVRLERVEFALWHTCGEHYEKQTLTTNADGQIIIERLRKGRWFIQETQALDGYIINDKVFAFYVTSDGLIEGLEVYEIAVENDLDSSANIVTQAWTKFYGNQYFIADEYLNYIEANDTVRITHHNIRPGTPMAFRPILHVRLEDGTSEVIHIGELQYYTVEYVTNWQPGIPIVMELLYEMTFDWTALPDGWEYVFFSEYLYRVNAPDYELLYIHNKNGECQNQTLHPIFPEQMPEFPISPNLPQTGASMSKIALWVGLGILALGLITVFATNFNLPKDYQTKDNTTK